MKLKYFSLILSFMLLSAWIKSASQSDAEIPALKEVFANSFYIGTSLNMNQIIGKDKKAVELVEKHFNTITAENIMKWEKIHPEPGKYNFEPVDSFVAFGRKNNMLIIGHTLLWHAQTPSWVFEDEDGKFVSRDTLLNRLKEHIMTVVGRYKGIIHGWDVVNEAIEDNGEFRKSKWYNIIGEDYIEKAFEFAHEADPKTELYYNDYNMWHIGKLKKVIELVKSLKSKNIKIDGIGLQGHWGLEYPSNNEIDFALSKYSELDVNLMITEHDVQVLPLPEKNIGADISKNYELQKKYNPFPTEFPDSMQVKLGKRYEDFFTLFNKYKNKISRVTFWGVSDSDSWHNNWPIFGRKAYPLLFDRNYLPKPAFKYIIKTVN
ncbi:MAG: endo-1,4-beta-xylanase [Ignavibacteriales bacterium]|nr:endo-1,4-beta-xylanase [Ignavibacteriales bacterium]